MYHRVSLLQLWSGIHSTMKWIKTIRNDKSHSIRCNWNWNCELFVKTDLIISLQFSNGLKLYARCTAARINFKNFEFSVSIGKCNKFFNELMRKRMNRVFFPFFSIDNVRLVRLALTAQSDDRFFSRIRGYQIHDFFFQVSQSISPIHIGFVCIFKKLTVIKQWKPWLKTLNRDDMHLLVECDYRLGICYSVGIQWMYEYDSWLLPRQNLALCIFLLVSFAIVENVYCITSTHFMNKFSFPSAWAYCCVCFIVKFF